MGLNPLLRHTGNGVVAKFGVPISYLLEFLVFR